MDCDDDRHRHCHRTGGAGYLRPGPSEHSSEKANRDRSVDPGQCPQTRRYAEGERHWKTDYCCGDAAEDVPTERLQVIAELGSQ